MAQDATISTTDIIGIAGTEVLVPVNLTKLNTIGSITLNIKFKKGVMTYTGEVLNKSFSGGFFSTGTKGDTIVTVSWFGSPGINLNGKLFDLKFNYIGGSSPIEFNFIEITNDRSVPYTIAQDDGSISASNNKAPIFIDTMPNSTINETETKTYLYIGSDLDADPLNFSIISGPTGAAITTDGNFSWTPTYEQAGTYSVIVGLSDGQVTVYDTTQVIVNNVNREPTYLNSLPDTTISETQTLTYLFTGGDPDNDVLEFALLNGPTGAAITNTGNFSWTPFLGQSGSYQLIFSLSDGIVNIYHTTNIVVSIKNNMPIFVLTLPDTTIVEMQTLEYLYTGTDTDGDELEYSLISGPTGATLDLSGNFNWTPALATAGEYNIIASLTDGKDIVFDTTKITVTAANKAPYFVITLPDTTIFENQELAFLCTGTDPDSDPLVFALVSSIAGATLDGSGNFSWTPNDSQIGVHNIVLSLTDGKAVVYDTTNITVIAENKAPYFVNTLPDTTVLETEALSFLYTGADSDSDPLTFALVTAIAGASINTDGNFNWTPSIGQAGVYNLVVSLTDGKIIVFDTTKVTITAINRAPYFVNTMPDTTIVETESLSFSYSATDSDSDPLTFALVTAIAGASMNTSGNFNWTPSIGQAGVYNLIVSLTDGKIVVFDTTSVIVTAANRTPYFTASIPDTTITEGIALTYQYLGMDPDGDVLTFALQSGPDGATISTSGLFNWTPATAEDIIATIIISLTDQTVTVYDTAEVSVLTDIIATNSLPTKFSLEQNYPNPFNPSTSIHYSLPEQANVNMTVYDIKGQKIQTLLNSEIKAGFHKISFDASNMAGGIYLYRIIASNSNGLNFISTKKMLLLK